MRYVGVTALVGAVVIARRLDAVTTPQLFGEDGFLFFHDDLQLGAEALLKPYVGFPYLGQRIIGFLGGLVAFESAPRVYTTAAIVVTASGLASFCLPGFRHLVQADWLRVLWCVAAACIPTEEGMPLAQLGGVLSTPSNLGWWVAIWLALLSLVRVPRSPLSIGMLGLGGALAIFSTPLAVLNLPLWVFRIWYGVRRARPRDVALGVVLVAAFAVLVAFHGTLGTGYGLRGFAVLGGLVADLRYLGALVLYRVAALVLPPARLMSMQETGPVAVAAIAVTAAVGFVVLSRTAEHRNRPAIVVALSFFIGSLILTTLGRSFWAGFSVARFPARYTVFPTAMVLLATVTLLDGLPRNRRWMAAIVVGALLVWSWHGRFVVEPLKDRDWPRWSGELERKLASGSRAPLRIPMNPAFAPLVFDPLDMATEIDVPADTILAGLGTQGTFKQLFICRCELLRAVEIRLSAAASSPDGALAMRLLDAHGTIVTEQTIARSELPLDGSGQMFFFDPIHGSAGQAYTVALQAMDNVAESTVYVLGSHGDPYPDGRAVLGGTVIDGDASFRYGCGRP